MTKLKKLVCIILSTVTLASLIPSMVFAENDAIFTDVKGNEYYAVAAGDLSKLGILEGYEDGSFGASHSITRAEMTAIICRMLKKDNEAVKAKGGADFDDVSSGHWASGYINVATKANIIEGDGDGKFRPEDDVKYEEALKMVVCALGFGDNVEVVPEDWSVGYISAAKNKGITNNIKGSKGIAATRGDIAVMVHNGLTEDLSKPIISVTAGTYNSNQLVKLTTSTKDAKIYYTIDGTEPTVKSAMYTKEITISKTLTLKAITIKSDVIASEVASADYTIKRSSSGGGGGSSSKKYTVSFDLNYESADKRIPNKTVSKNKKIDKPNAPNRTNYIFGGWYKESDCITPFDFENEIISKNTTLYALWNTEDTIIISDIDESKIIDSDNGYRYFESQLLLEVSQEKTYSDIALLLNKFSGRIIGYIADTNSYQAEFDNISSESDLNNIADNLAKVDYIQDVILNYADDVSIEAYYPNDEEWADIPSLVQNWNENLPYGANWGAEAIKAPSAWEYRNEFSNLDIGLIEIGKPENHNDLNISERLSSSDKSIGYDEHATHVCGTMAATFDNEIGIAGIAPNENIGEKNKYNIYSYALGCKGGVQGHKEAIAKLLNKNVKVINVSMGYKNEIIFAINHGNSDARKMISSEANDMSVYLKKKLDKEKDFIIVKSAGNTNNYNFVADNGTGNNIFYGFRLANKNDINILHENIQAINDYFYTAITNEKVKSHIIVVGACKNNGNKDYEICDFSNIGDRVDVIAPGDDIESTVGTDQYIKLPGTSMAAPHVSGVATMVWSCNPKLTGEDVKKIITTTSIQNVKGSEKKLIDAEQAVKCAMLTKTNNGLIIGYIKDGSTLNNINDAKVEIYDSNIKVGNFSTYNGLYYISLMPGTYTLKVSKEGYGNKELPISVTSDTINQLDDIFMETEQSITGKVISNTGEPLSNVSVTFFKNNIEVKTVQTNENGIFTAYLEKGIYNIKIYHLGYQSTEKTNISLEENQMLVIQDDFILNKDEIKSTGLKGIIKDSKTSKIIVDASIAILDSDNKKLFEAVSDKDGYFEIQCGAGTYNVVIGQNGYDEHKINNVTVLSGLYDMGDILLSAHKDTDGELGTENNPYKIETYEQFDQIRNNPSAYYMLMNDITIKSGYEPISFSGTFDGNNKNISYIVNKNDDTGSTYKIGLFNSISGTVKNLNVSADIQISCSVGVSGEANIYAGGLTYVLDETGLIDNCHVKGNINCTYTKTGVINVGEDCIGGIVAVMYGGKINKCSMSGNLSLAGMVKDYVGGLVGTMWDGTIYNSYYKSGTINCSAGNKNYTSYAYSYAGGIVGDGYSGTINNCLSAATSIKSSASASSDGIFETYRISRIGELNNNYADKNMLINGSTVMGTTSDNNGESITIDELNSKWNSYMK